MLEWDQSDRLAKALRHAGVSRQEMADYLGVHPNTISNYVHGHIQPDKRTLMLWAARCGVSFEWLDTGEGCTSEE